jgi:hypothetical protein
MSAAWHAFSHAPIEHAIWFGHVVVLPAQSTTAELSAEQLGHVGPLPLPLPLPCRAFGPHAHAIVIATTQSARMSFSRARTYSIQLDDPELVTTNRSRALDVQRAALVVAAQFVANA